MQAVLTTHLHHQHIRPLCLLRQGVEEVSPHMGQTALVLRLTAIVQGEGQESGGGSGWQSVYLSSGLTIQLGDYSVVGVQ
jgi:hypothetical protein